MIGKEFFCPLALGLNPPSKLDLNVIELIQEASSHFIESKDQAQYFLRHLASHPNQICSLEKIAETLDLDTSLSNSQKKTTNLATKARGIIRNTGLRIYLIEDTGPFPSYLLGGILEKGDLVSLPTDFSEIEQLPLSPEIETEIKRITSIARVSSPNRMTFLINNSQRQLLFSLAKQPGQWHNREQIEQITAELDGHDQAQRLGRNLTKIARELKGKLGLTQSFLTVETDRKQGCRLTVKEDSQNLIPPAGL